MTPAQDGGPTNAKVSFLALSWPCAPGQKPSSVTGSFKVNYLA
jgi:hypothetical protein